MLRNNESSESSEPKIKFKDLENEIRAMDKKMALDYLLGTRWYATPRPLQVAVMARAGWNWLELFVATSIENLGQIKNDFYQSEGNIAALLGVSDGAVRKAAARLKKMGILVREGKRGQRARTWTLKSTTSGTSSSPLLGHHNRPIRDTEATTSGTSHNKKKDLKKNEDNNKKEKKGGKPPAFLPNILSFYSKSEIQSRLENFPWDGHRLDTPKGLASCWAYLKEAFRPPSGARAGGNADSAPPPASDAAWADAQTEFQMEASRAHQTLKQMEDRKTAENVRNWLKWYIATRGFGDRGYITEFSASWGDFLAYEEEEKKAEEAREAEEYAKREAQRKMEALEGCRQSPILGKIYQAAIQAYGEDEVGKEWECFRDLFNGLGSDRPYNKIDSDEVDQIVEAIVSKEFGLHNAISDTYFDITDRKRTEWKASGGN